MAETKENREEWDEEKAEAKFKRITLWQKAATMRNKKKTQLKNHKMQLWKIRNE